MARTVVGAAHPRVGPHHDYEINTIEAAFLALNFSMALLGFWVTD
jgi:hypothetical protein